MNISDKKIPVLKVPQSFIEMLKRILEQAKGTDGLKVKEIFAILAEKRYAAILVMFSFPFCIPIQIPGFSTPFGIILSFIGLRIAFGKKPWWPEWILEKKMSSQHIEKLANKTINIVLLLQKISYPRLIFLTQNSVLGRIHGILIFCLAIFLALPLPIPFSNMFAAFPIFFIGLGLLEDDGLMILFAYFLTLICLLTFLALFLFGRAQLS